MALSRKEIQKIVDQIGGGLSAREKKGLIDALYRKSAEREVADTASPTSEAELQKQLKYIEASLKRRHEELDLEKEVLTILGDKDELRQRDLQRLELEKSAALDLLQAHQNSEKQDKAAIKAAEKKIVQLKTQITLQNKLNAAEDTGVEIGKNFAEQLGVSSSGLSSLVSEAGSLKGGLQTLGKIGKGVASGLAENLLNPLNIMSSMTVHAKEVFMSLDKLNY